MMQRWAGVVVAIAIAIAIAAVIHCAAQPIDFLKKHVVIDDAIYYLVPARNFVDGHGYSLDGIHRSNGVQPLYAMLVTCIAYLCPADSAALRAMVLGSGGCWILAGAMLYALLRRLHPVSGLLALLVWLMAGFEVRFALMGMENGMHALVWMGVLFAAHRVAALAPDHPEWRWRAFVFGCLVALLALSRIENGVIALLFGLWLAWRRRLGGSLWRGMVRTWPFALPILVGGCAWLLFSRIYFGEWLPISGTVKSWSRSTNEHAIPTAVAIPQHLRQATLLSLSGPVFAIYEAAVRYLQRLPTPNDFFAITGLCLLPVLGQFPRWIGVRRTGLPTAATIYAILFGFVLVHIFLMSWKVADYTHYSTWYFVSEILLVCLAIGAVAGAIDRWWRVVLTIPLVVVVFASAVLRVPTWFDEPQSFVTEPYVELGRWLEDWLPPGSTVGAFAAGYVALEAQSHTVTNLDGLINDGRYVREYVMQNRVTEYFEDEGIDFFADCLPAGQWQLYLGPTAKMFPADPQPLHCWPNRHGNVTAVLERGGTRTGAVPHPLGKLFFDTLARGQHRTIAAHESAKLTEGEVIITSYLQPPQNDLRHIVASPAVAATAVDVRGLIRLQQANHDLGSGTRLLAVEVPPEPVTVPGQALLRIYTESPQVTTTPALVEFVVRLSGGDEAGGDGVADATSARVTARLSGLQSHTVHFVLPASVPTGRHQIHIEMMARDGAASGKPLGSASVGFLRLLGR